jgi:hypothetical protein
MSLSAAYCRQLGVVVGDSHRVTAALKASSSRTTHNPDKEVIVRVKSKDPDGT